MKVVVISDTHGQDFLRDDMIEPCDLFIHCGDISPMANHSIEYQKEFFWAVFVPQMARVPAKHKVFVAGNHDFYLYEVMKQEAEAELRSKLPPNVHYLRDNGVEIEGLHIWGAPWVTNLKNWAFSKSEQGWVDPSLMDIYSMIPKGVDILVSHGPARGYSDTIMEYNLTEKLGSSLLISTIFARCPRLVVSGHIHSANHHCQTMMTDCNTRTLFYCTSLLDEAYEMAYKPLVLEVDRDNIVEVRPPNILDDLEEVGKYEDA